MEYIIRKASLHDVRPAFELALRVFMEYEAPGYKPEGAEHFLEGINKKIGNPGAYLSG